MIIHDPTTGLGAAVDALGRLAVLATARSPLVQAAKVGEAIVIHSNYSATAAQEILSFQNDDPVNFFIEKIRFGTDTAGDATIAVAAGTAAGTPVVALPLNRGVLPLTRQYTAFGDASVTGLTPGDIFAMLHAGADVADEIDFGGALILGNGDEICVTTNVTAAVSCALFGYWAEVS